MSYSLFNLFKKSNKFFKSFIFGSQEQGPSETRVVIHYFTKNLFPPLLMILMDPQRSICSNSRGRVVLTHLFDLKEFLTYFPLAQASQTLPSLYLMVGRPTTRYFETNLFKRERLAWPSLLCHNITSSFKALKQVKLFWGREEIHTL